MAFASDITTPRPHWPRKRRRNRSQGFVKQLVECWLPPDSPSLSLVVWPLDGLTQPLARARVLLEKAGTPTDWVVLTPALDALTESYSVKRSCTNIGDIKDFAHQRRRMQGEHINRFQQDISRTDIPDILKLLGEHSSRTGIQDILEAPRSSAS
jgi:hypothetical protein